MKPINIFAYLVLFSFFFSCQDELKIVESASKLNKHDNTAVNQPIKIAILSDIHAMDQSLLVKNGTAFQTYLAKDPKLLEFSSDILQAVVKKLIMQKPDIVLISGDLTKDGERISHEYVARMLRQLTLKGIKVVVTVGNHDVNNPEALRYINEKTVKTPNVQAVRIPFIYADFGYKDAISRDTNSLSFINEPINGLWIISIDANKYYLNTTTNVWGGIIKTETMSWIKEQMTKAQSQGKTVIGMMHQGLMEHYAGQNEVDPGYVVDNPDSTANKLMNAGMKIIFTGHYHATDITKKIVSDKFIFDVETGSTVTYPCTYRMLTISGNEYKFERQITMDLMPQGFDAYAKTFSEEHLDGYFSYVLNQLYGVPPEYALGFAPYFRDAALAHFAGDEEPNAQLPGQMLLLDAIDSTHKLSRTLGTLWTDIDTPDNNLTINMVTGAVY